MVAYLPLVLLAASAAEYQLLTPYRIFLLIGSVLLGAGIGGASSIYAMGRLGIGRSFPFLNLFPFLVMLWSLLFLDEKLTWLMLPGTMLILAGLYLIVRTGSGKEALALEGLSRRDMWSGIFFALTATLGWSISITILSVALEGLNAVVANSIRVPVVAAFSFSIAAARGKLRQLKNVKPRTIIFIAVSGILNWGVVMYFFAVAIQTIGPSRSSIIGATSPLFAAPLSILFLKEKPRVFILFGTVLTVVGIMLVI